MNRMMHIIAAGVALSVAITFNMVAEAKSLLYYYDFDHIQNGSLVYLGSNKGTGSLELTPKLKESARTIPYTTSGALGSSGAYYASNRNSLWLDGGSSGLGCGTTTGFTIAFWLKTSASHTKDWTDMMGFTIGGEDYRFEYNTENTVTFQVFASGNQCITNTAAGGDVINQTVAGRWQHVSLVVKPNVTRSANAWLGMLYIDGEKVGELKVLSTGNLQKIFIGPWVLQDGKDRTDGWLKATNTGIDELAVFDYPITEEQVKWLCTNRPGQPADGYGRAMPVYWPFDTTNDRGLDGMNCGTGNDSPYKWVPSGSNYAMYKDAALGSTHAFWFAKDYRPVWRIDASDSDALGATIGSGFTFSFWLKADSAPTAWRSVFGYRIGSNTHTRLAWGNESPRHIYAYGGGTLEGTIIHSASTWRHFCLVWNHEQRRTDIYVDGVYTAYVNETGRDAFPDSLQVNSMMVGPSVPGTNAGAYYTAEANVEVDETAFFNYSVTTGQIAWLAANRPALPPLDVANVTRSVSADGKWSGSLASWHVVVDGTSTSRIIWPVFEDKDIDVAVDFASASTLTNDTFVTCRSLTLSNATEAATIAPAIKAADGSRFAPQALTVGDGVQVTMPLYSSVGGTLTFGTGSKIVFDISDYNGEDGAFSVEEFVLPEGVNNVLACFGVTDDGFALSLSQDGKTVYVKPGDNVVATAKWVGAVDGDLSVASNWECRNASGTVLSDALPGEFTSIIASGTLNVPEGTELPWQYCRFVVEDVTLSADCDWRGLGTAVMKNSPTVSLAGHKLYVYPVSEQSTFTGEGELHLDVEGAYLNTRMKFSDALKLVKEGAGTYIGGLAQTYTGGTLVAEGTAQPPDGNGADTVYSRESFGAFGTGRITVSEGATFDLRADYAYYGYTSLDGGTLTNTKADMTQTTWGGSGIGSLTKDSTLNVPNSIVYQSSTDLGGNTLTIPITSAKSLYLRNVSFTNGTVDITSGGWFRTVTVCDAKTVDFKVNCALAINATLSVHDYNAVYGDDANSGTAALNVYGTFTPATNYFYGCTMQDGSTIDLSAKTETWSTSSSFTSGSKTVSFADNATVKIKLGARVVANGTKIVGWTSEPANLAGLRFKSADGEKFAVVKKDDGLYLLRGLFFVVR